MKKNKKTALLIATLWPLAYFVIFFAAIFLLSFHKGKAHEELYVVLLLMVHTFTILLGFALMVIYIINVFKNPVVVGNNKVLWVLLIVFLNIFAMIVYWYMFIWRGPESYECSAGIANQGNVSFGSSESVPAKYCTSCGVQNAVESSYCYKCGCKFDENLPARMVGKNDDYTIGKIIPYKNPGALIGYYCGVFSVIPFFPIGVVGFIMGIIGLKYARAHPEVRGATHAWVGIIAGGLFGLCYLVATILFIVYSIMHP